MGNDEFCEKLKDLLIRSEERIDRTNQMVLTVYLLWKN